MNAHAHLNLCIERSLEGNLLAGAMQRALEERDDNRIPGAVDARAASPRWVNRI